LAALAAATQSELISNDDHLLARRDRLPVRILKPGEFFAELMRGGADDRAS
jgi:predicted nucleic acid-binding protein